MANFRPLQPAPMDQDTPSQPQSRLMLTQKPKRTVTLGACVACRKRKSKCDGYRPICTCCSQKETDCMYELGPNEKPSQVMKRKNEEMQGELSNLRHLYDFLRLRPEHEALEILRRIRTNPQDTSPSRRIQELADYVRHGDMLIQQPSYTPPSTFHYEPDHSITLPPLRFALDSPSSLASPNLSFQRGLSVASDEPTSQRRRHISDMDVSARSGNQSPFLPPTSIKAILHHPSPAAAHDPTTDPRLVSIKNWTMVTADSSFLVAVYSAWETLEYSYYHYLDLDAFLDDMANRRTDFCSSLLVNALLASACFHSGLVKDRQKPFAESSMTTVFYREAKRLWDLEEGTDSLTKIQAAICLFLVLGKHGRDKEGYVFLLEACRMASYLGLFQQQTPGAAQRPLHIPQQTWSRVWAVTAWALFNFQLSMSFTYSLALIIDAIPSEPIPYNHNPIAEALFRAECSKNIIILDCFKASHLQNNQEGKISPNSEQIAACHQRLKTWWESRPLEIRPDDSPSQENLLCAMMYNINIINLFQPLLEVQTPKEQTDVYRDRARSATSVSLKEIRRLLALQETRHGWANTITYILHPISVASFGSLDEISQNSSISTSLERTEPYQGLLTCLRALGNLSSYCYYAQPLFRLLTQKCQSLDVQLPMEVQSTLDYYTSEEWTKNAANLVSSQYIADSRETVKGARMDEIVSAWEGLSLNEAEREKGNPRES